MKTIKLGLDIHGVLSELNEIDIENLIEDLNNNFPKFNFELHVISGKPVMEQLIELLHIHKQDLSKFRSFHSIIEHIYCSRKWYENSHPNFKIWKDDKDEWWASPEEVWWNSKGIICANNDIDILVDNDLRYRNNAEEHGVYFIHFNPRFESYRDLLTNIEEYIEALKALSWLLVDG